MDKPECKDLNTTECYVIGIYTCPTFSTMFVHNMIYFVKCLKCLKC
jgi:hypothetical protein